VVAWLNDQDLRRGLAEVIPAVPEVPLATSTQLMERLERIDSRYRGRFAGHPRISRDPDELIQLRREVDEVAAEAEGLADDQLAQRIAASQELFDKELERIEEARAAGPAAVQAHRIVVLANFVYGRYTRFFAGQNRATRDVSLLEELVTDLKAFETDLHRLISQGADRSDDLVRIRDSIQIYEREVDAIRSARGSDSLPQQAQRYATLANDLFDRYRYLFANKPRISRSLRALDTLLSGLGEIHAQMIALRTRGVTGDVHAKNIALVGDRLDSWNKEKQAISEVFDKAPLSDRIGNLGGAANDVFKQYREHFAGKDRRTRELAMLGKLIEELWYLQREMDRIDEADGDDTNARNLSIVTDQLRMYDREYGEIVKVQSAN